ISHSANSKLCNFRQASRIATISACAVGSFVVVTLFTPSAIISPPRTITAPNGPPRPERTFSKDNASARAIKLLDIILNVRSDIGPGAAFQFAARDCNAAGHFRRNENLAPSCDIEIQARVLPLPLCSGRSVPALSGQSGQPFVVLSRASARHQPPSHHRTRRAGPPQRHRRK